MSMGKATKSSTDISALAEDPGDQISPELAGKVLIPHFGDVHVARTRLNDAICQNRVASYADGVRVRADYFASCMRVLIAHGTTDRFEIRPFAGLHGNNPETGRPYVWTVSRKDVLDLIDVDKPAVVGNPPKHKPGRKKVYNPEFVVEEAWAYVYEHGCPTSLEGLANDLKVAVGEGIPEITKAKEFLGRAYDRMEQLQNHMGEKPGEKRPRRRH
jgi:hypothetical protein